MKIAVLMSTYNGEKFIEKQIDSILCQVGCDIDLQVRDDGSQDNTVEILKRYEQKGKLIWTQGDNLKPAKSFLHLLYYSEEYDYYAFADQDDLWDKDKLIRGIQCLQEYNDRPAIYYSKVRFIDAEDNIIYKNSLQEHDRVVIKDNYWNEMIICGVPGCTMILNKKIVDILKNSKFPSKVKMHDSYVQSMCAALGGVILCDEKAHMGYRQHANNAIGGKKGIWHGVLHKLKVLTAKRKVFISDHARQFLGLYDREIPQENLSMIKTVAEYRDSLKNRIRLAFSKELKFDKIRDCVYIRLLILFGKI